MNDNKFEERRKGVYAAADGLGSAAKSCPDFLDERPEILRRQIQLHEVLDVVR